jgi:Helix-turn-helix domain
MITSVRQRMYPTQGQSAVMSVHCAHARCVYNLGLEQRRCWSGYPAQRGFVIRDLRIVKINRRWATVLVPKVGPIRFHLTYMWAKVTVATSARVTLRNNQWHVSLTTPPKPRVLAGSGQQGWGGPGGTGKDPSAASGRLRCSGAADPVEQPSHRLSGSTRRSPARGIGRARGEAGPRQPPAREPTRVGNPRPSVRAGCQGASRCRRRRPRVRRRPAPTCS